MRTSNRYPSYSKHATPHPPNELLFRASNNAGQTYHSCTDLRAQTVISRRGPSRRNTQQLQLLFRGARSSCLAVRRRLRFCTLMCLIPTRPVMTPKGGEMARLRKCSMDPESPSGKDRRLPRTAAGYGIVG